MIPPADHLTDEALSALLEEPRSGEAAAHLNVCAECEARLAALDEVVGLLAGLPSIDPPRDFRLGPRLLADPPNLVRLRRWYRVARVGAASLAAAFAFLSFGALYVDSHGPVRSELASAPALQSAPSTGAASAPAAPPQPVARAVANSGTQPGAAPPAAQAPAAPAAPGASAAAAAPAVSSAGQLPAGTVDAADQVAAATSVRPLPTPVPTPSPVVPVSAPAPVAPLLEPGDPAAPLRVAALAAGLLAIPLVLAVVLIRRRLRAASHLVLE